MLNLYRRAVLGVAGFAPVAGVAKRYGPRLGARRFVAGDDAAEALDALVELRSSGREVIVDVLGEYVATADAARAMAAEVAVTIETLTRAGIAPVVSVKPTQVGLALDRDLAAEHVLQLALDAEAAGGSLALDMEDVRYVDGTLELLTRTWAGGAARTSGVLQAYLHRTPGDLEALIAAAPDPRALQVRIVKGAYAERPDLVHGDMRAIRRAFVALSERAWRAGAQVNVATHDERLILETAAFVRGANLSADKLEFQLLYGVKPGLQRTLAEAGHAVRIYVPIGRDWYGYFSRRLAERPANLAVVLRGLVG
ncbi:MAG: proline dehydrogenase [Trueperaceae bacterium]|nr:MAG: proline dehydrogenase [Trueperaceae bacterium]